MAAFETRLTGEMARTYRDAGFWHGETFHDVLARRAGRHPDREALYDGRRRVTYRQLAERVDAVAAVLQAHGITRRDVVTVQLPNRIDFACVFFAVERLGAVAVQASTDFRERELAFILEFSQSAAFICPGSFRGFDHERMVRGLRPSLPRLRVVASTDAAAGPDTVSLAGAIAGRRSASGLVPVAMDPDEIFRMAFTSGTTGNPKAVIHSHETTLSAARIQNLDLGVGEEDVLLLYLPLGLNWGYLALLQTLIAGARAVLLDRFSAGRALALIEAERVTNIPTAPAAIIELLDAPELDRTDLSSLRQVVSGGASCPVETIREFRARMPGDFIELYGMLESGFHSYTRPGDDPEAASGTVGWPATGLGLRILDDANRDVAPGETGEIAGRGPSIHLGYHRNPAANAAAFTPDGWFRTGDIGYVDGNGNLVISGRSKELVNRGGKKFHPREIEEILYASPKILHAAVVGMPDARLGERNCLCVVPRRGQDVTLEEMTALLDGKVATYKLPEALEIFEVLPFTPTGQAAASSSRCRSRQEAGSPGPARLREVPCVLASSIIPQWRMARYRRAGYWRETTSNDWLEAAAGRGARKACAPGRPGQSRLSRISPPGAAAGGAFRGDGSDVRRRPRGAAAQLERVRGHHQRGNAGRRAVLSVPQRLPQPRGRVHPGLYRGVGAGPFRAAIGTSTIPP